MVSKRTHEWAPLASFINVDRFLQDAGAIADAARGPFLTKLQSGAEPAAELHAGPGAPRLPADRPAEEVRQAERRSARRQARRPRQRRPQAGRVAADVRRRDVVPGSLDLRLPTHRDVHHPVRDADGGDLVLCLQHRRGLAADRREHVPERDSRGMVQGARQARRLRQPAQAGAAAGRRAAGVAAHPARRPAGRVAARRPDARLVPPISALAD